MDRKNSVKEILIKCMPQETDLTEISEDTNIYEDLQYDSLAIVELLTAIEEEFGVDFTELDDFEDLLCTYRGIVMVIEKLIQDRG